MFITTQTSFVLQSSLLGVSLYSWVLALSAAFIIGVSKSGVKGTALIAVTLMALAFETKASTGLVVPLFIVGDIFAVIYYNRHTQWKYIARFLPWTMLGVFMGNSLGKDLDEATFKIGMAIVILGSVIMMYWWDRRKSKVVPTHWAFAGLMGLLAGITTMIGNLAGSFANIFFLAMRLPKNEFIGTAAWLFFIINLFKLPFHIWSWGTITTATLLFDLKLVPAIILGLLMGVRLIKIITDNFYRKMILILTAAGALAILFR